MDALIGPLVFLYLLIMFVGIIWVFTDASVNSSQSAILWGLVVLFGGILGILLYVLLGRDQVGEAEHGTRREPGRSPGQPSNREPSRRERPSHVCESCGEEYFTDPETEIRTCRHCGGIKVESRQSMA